MILLTRPFAWSTGSTAAQRKIQLYATAPTDARLNPENYRSSKKSLDIKRRIGHNREMKIWLDDMRTEPKGWVRCMTPGAVIEALRRGIVDELSLDHDLGEAIRGNGYDVLLWIEEQVFTNPDFVLPKINIHTANPAARIRMIAAAKQIQKIYKERK